MKRLIRREPTMTMTSRGLVVARGAAAVVGVGVGGAVGEVDLGAEAALGAGVDGEVEDAGCSVVLQLSKPGGPP